LHRLKLAARKPKRWTRTTLVNEDNPVAPNLLNRDFAADRPATKWVSDISYFSIKGSWHYLTIILDLADRAIVGWVISDDMSAKATSLAALERAVAKRKPAENMIFHSDRGVQYTCDEMRQHMVAIGAVQSMSRKGNCWDNAVAESFFKTIKEECINRHEFTSKAHAWSISSCASSQKCTLPSSFFLLPSSFFLLPSSFFLLPSSFSSSTAFSSSILNLSPIGNHHP
jgi:putative transposase